MPAESAAARRNEYADIAARILARAGGPAEVRIAGLDRILTRFGAGAITQNLGQTKFEVFVRLVESHPEGGKTARSVITDTGDRALDRALDACRSALRFAPVDRDALPPAAFDPVPPAAGRWDDAVVDLTAEALGDAVADAVAAADRAAVTASGSAVRSVSRYGVFNSEGTAQYHEETQVQFSVTATAADSSGWGTHIASRAADFPFAAVVERALATARDGAKPGVAEPGAYEVILPPAAVADLLLFLATEGFNGLAFAEGRSPLGTALGERRFDERLTLVDDPRHPLGSGAPFDHEGAPKPPLTLIENGRVVGMAHDRRTAARLGVAGNGRAMPQPDSEGPFPVNLTVAPGADTTESLIATTKRGLLVNHLHYTNVIDPVTLTLTGMTRDGVWLIENGRIVRPVRNLRFTDSLFSLLGEIAGIGDTAVTAAPFWGASPAVPTLRLARMRFTSGTEF